MARDDIGATTPSTTLSMSSKMNNHGRRTQKPKVSDQLEEDTQAMEERLIQLRMKMLEDKKKFNKELPAKYGGSRWRSAQEDRGSISRYAKDLEEKLKKTPPTKKSSSKDVDDGKLKKKRTKSIHCDGDSHILSITSVAKWTITQVLEWLTSLQLDEYHSAFEFHQVTGARLLDMNLEELATIGITRLSSRNLIWTELEKIKEKATRAGLTTNAHNEAAEIIDSKIRDVTAVPELPSPTSEQAGVHWSRVKPLRDNTVVGDGEVPINLADGEYNEDASHASFMKALLDWRAGDETGNDAKDDGMWFNPVASNNNQEESDAGGGGALWDGEYDEEKEREAFTRAVLAWRRGNSDVESRPSTTTTTTETERIEEGCSTEVKKSCWHCYRVVAFGTLVHDQEINKSFCSSTCQVQFHNLHAHLYQKQKQSIIVS